MPAAAPVRSSQLGSICATLTRQASRPAAKLVVPPGEASSRAVPLLPSSAVTCTTTSRRATGASPSTLVLKYHTLPAISVRMPAWIIHTPRFTTRSGMRRSVVHAMLAAISASSRSNGHQWNHSNSVISKGRH